MEVAAVVVLAARVTNLEPVMLNNSNNNLPSKLRQPRKARSRSALRATLVATLLLEATTAARLPLLHLRLRLLLPRAKPASPRKVAVGANERLAMLLPRFVAFPLPRAL